MKELLAGFAAEVFRPVVTLLIPGFWALSPWTIALFLHYSVTWSFVCVHRDGSGLVFVVAATAVGLVLENLSARLERCFFDRYTEDYSNWFDYLALALETEPIGVRYIRAIVLRMKFEFGMGLAGILALGGAICTPVSVVIKIIFVSIVLILSLYFVCEGKESVELLEKTRIQLLKRIRSSNKENDDVF
jgi:hypothetical protein